MKNHSTIQLYTIRCLFPTQMKLNDNRRIYACGSIVNYNYYTQICNQKCCALFSINVIENADSKKIYEENKTVLKNNAHIVFCVVCN